MQKLSVGVDSTLGNYLMLCNAVFGKESKQSKFIQNKIDESPDGAYEEVIAPESQMMYLLIEMGL